MVLLIALLTLFVIKVCRLVFNGIGQGRIRLAGFYPEWASPTFGILRFLIIAAARDTSGLEEEPPPFVYQTLLGDASVSYEINAVTRAPGKAPRITSELHGHILDRFRGAGVEIASPSYAAVRDGNRIAVPDGHLPAEYVPPPWRIHPFEGLFRKQGGATEK